MPKYRKRPIVIEAVQFLGTRESAEEVIAFCTVAIWGYKYKNMAIETLEGRMIVKPRDWIIKGVKGEFYPCRADIFKMTYEAIEEER